MESASRFISALLVFIGVCFSDLAFHLQGDDRIQFLCERLSAIHKEYQMLKGEVSIIDRRKKRARGRERDRESELIIERAMTLVIVLWFTNCDLTFIGQFM